MTCRTCEDTGTIWIVGGLPDERIAERCPRCPRGQQ